IYAQASGCATKSLTRVLLAKLVIGGQQKIMQFQVSVLRFFDFIQQSIELFQVAAARMITTLLETFREFALLMEPILDMLERIANQRQHLASPFCLVCVAASDFEGEAYAFGVSLGANLCLPGCLDCVVQPTSLGLVFQYGEVSLGGIL